MVITMRSGLVVDLQNPIYIPCSPDNIVTLSNGEQGLVEYKCLYKAPKDSLTAKQQAALRLSDFCTILNSKVLLQLKRTVRCTHIYFNQVQLFERQPWCQFVLWTLQGTKIETILANPDLKKKCLPHAC